MAENRKKRHRYSYLNDFKRNVAGEFIYSGDMYECSASAEEIKKQKTLLLILAAALAGAVIACGCIKAPGMRNSFYLIIPYIFEVAAAGSIVSAVLSFFGSENPMREYVYLQSLEALPGRSVIETVFAALGFLCELLYCILNREFTGPALVFLLLKIVSSVFCLCMRKTAKKYLWMKKDCSEFCK